MSGEQPRDARMKGMTNYGEIIDWPDLEVLTVPATDTGIGREAGFRDDDHLVEVAEAEREVALALLTPEGRAKVEAAEREAARKFSGG